MKSVCQTCANFSKIVGCYKQVCNDCSPTFKNFQPKEKQMTDKFIFENEAQAYEVCSKLSGSNNWKSD